MAVARATRNEQAMIPDAGTGVWLFSLALVNAGLAQNKGRSRWYWFLFSLLLGPLATFVIVVWPPRVETTEAPVRP